MPSTFINYSLKWANPKSKNNNIDIFAANLSSEVKNLELYNLFKEKYPSVHHASIITDKNNKSKEYGFITFIDKKEAEKCVNEMNGFLFHNKLLIIKKNIKDVNIQEVVYIFSENIIDLESNFIGILKGNKGPLDHLVCTEEENCTPLLFSSSGYSNIINWRLYFKEKKFGIFNKYNEDEKKFWSPRKYF